MAASPGIPLEPNADLRCQPVWVHSRHPQARGLRVTSEGSLAVANVHRTMISSVNHVVLRGLQLSTDGANLMDSGWDHQTVDD